ncbi:MAG: helix-turn-helix domain-containing protein [Pseudonocardiaceae bacterium]
MAGTHSADGSEWMRLACQLADEIRARRHAMAWAQPELAARIGYTPQYVSLAERPKQGLASAALIQAIDTALDAGGVLLALRDQADAARKACRPGASPTMEADDDAGREPGTPSEGAEVTNSKRRELITSAAAITFGASLDEPVVSILAAADEPQVPTRVRMGDVRDLRCAWETVRASMSRAGGGAARHQALAALRWATAMQESSCTPAARVELAAMTAKLADSAAWASFDAGKHGSARQLSLLGLQAARVSGDLGMRSWVASGLARQEIYVGNWSSGLELVQLAFTAGDALTRNAIAELHTVKALAYARKLDAAQCRRCSEIALDTYRPDLIPNDPFWLSYFTPAKLERDLAYARYDLLLGDDEIADGVARRADLIEHLSAAFQQYSPDRVLNKAIVVTRLATLLCLEGEQRLTHQRTQEAITLAGQVRSARLADDLRVLLRVLPAGDRANDAARDLRHRLFTALTEMT